MNDRTAHRTRVPRWRASVAPLLIGLAVLTFAACGSDGTGNPGFADQAATSEATYSFTIPLGAGEALDEGTPLEILPAELNAHVGETIEIVNLDERGHNVGPWFVGEGETVRQEFTSPGVFEGVCTVHPSGELVLRVEA